VVEVHLWAGLRRLTGGAVTVGVEASTVGQMLDRLVELHPGLAPVVEAGVSVSVDGAVAPGRFTPLSEMSEVYLMQRVKGG
jgi:molybdopterin converting factor small subunit